MPKYSLLIYRLGLAMLDYVRSGGVRLGRFGTSNLGKDMFY